MWRHIHAHSRTCIHARIRSHTNAYIRIHVNAHIRSYLNPHIRRHINANIRSHMMAHIRSDMFCDAKFVGDDEKYNFGSNLPHSIYFINFQKKVSQISHIFEGLICWTKT